MPECKTLFEAHGGGATTRRLPLGPHRPGLGTAWPAGRAEAAARTGGAAAPVGSPRGTARSAPPLRGPDGRDLHRGVRTALHQIAKLHRQQEEGRQT